ncbi:hypothetical protein V5O48_005389 [Marasmius crinis-equi]|uniref:Thioesterase domain-containing protein n=1 Tax=Marasmius crinis-equi TaxID=585013 RepID=A0ABR3FMD9_9AGAR
MDADFAEVSSITGNASDEAKMLIVKYLRSGGFFGDFIWARLRASDTSILNSTEEPFRKEGRAVFRLKVENDMLNPVGILHGACSSLLIDSCTWLLLSAYVMETTGKSRPVVSQAINTVLHSPAHLDDELKIVTTTMSVGNRSIIAKAEVWNVTHRRLVASGTQIAMFPSPQVSKL